MRTFSLYVLNIVILTFTPRLAASTRSDVEKPTTAHFVVLYGVKMGAGMRPPKDDTFRMWPKPWRTMTRYAAIVLYTTPRMLTSARRFQ